MSEEEKPKYSNMNGDFVLFEIISKPNVDGDGRDYPEEIKKKDKRFYIRINNGKKYRIWHKDIHALIKLLLNNDVKDNVFQENLYSYYRLLGKLEGERKNAKP